MLRPTANAWRDRCNLDGVWRFSVDADGVGRDQRWWRAPLPGRTEVPVPASYNDLFADESVRGHVGDVWYQTSVHVPARWDGERIVLRFDAATHRAVVWVGDTRVVEHEGGYTPFEADVTDAVAVGADNRVTVVVDNTLSWESIPPGYVEDTPDGPRQRYYHDFFNYAGLHRSVWLYTTPTAHVSDVTVVTGLDGTGGTVGYEVDTAGDTGGLAVRAVLRDDTGAEVASTVGASGTLVVDDVHPWRPGEGYLYELCVELSDGEDRAVDAYSLDVGVPWCSPVLDSTCSLDLQAVEASAFRQRRKPIPSVVVFSQGSGLTQTRCSCNLISVRTAYKCRAYPDAEQAALLGRTFGCVRLVWNKTLAERHRRYHTEGKSTSYKETDAALSQWKKTDELAFLSEVSSVPLQQTLRHQHTAFQNFFAGRARYPRFKSRNSRQSAHYTRSAFRLRDGRLWLAKTAAPLEIVWSWPEVDLVTINPTTAIVSREPDGRWFVTFAVETADPEPAPETGHAVGVDLGTKEFAVTSDEERIANPRHLERKARNLARYQRRLARKQRGSNNRRKAKKKVARAHRKVRNARQDFLHRTSTNLVRDADVIALEDLSVEGMSRSARGTVDSPGRNVRAKAGLNRSVRDAALGEFRRQVEYKAERTGKRVVVIDRWHPSSKTCSHCGYLLGELKLSVRAWTCPDCRTRHDRDLNAAKNILAAGRAVAACGADIRRDDSVAPQSATKQEPTGASPTGPPVR